MATNSLSTWSFSNISTPSPTCGPCTWLVVGPAYGSWTTRTDIPPLATTHVTVDLSTNATKTSLQCNRDVFSSYWTPYPTFGPYGYGLDNSTCGLQARILKVADKGQGIATGTVTAPQGYLDLGINLFVRGAISTAAPNGATSCLSNDYISLSSRPPLYTGRIFPTNVTLTANFGSTTKTVSTELVYRLPDLTDYYPGQGAVQQCTLVKFDAVPNTFTDANYLTVTTTVRNGVTEAPVFQPIIQPPATYSPITQPKPNVESPPQAAPAQPDQARPGEAEITKLLPQITAIIDAGGSSSGSGNGQGADSGSAGSVVLPADSVGGSENGKGVSESSDVGSSGSSDSSASSEGSSVGSGGLGAVIGGLISGIISGNVGGSLGAAGGTSSSDSGNAAGAVIISRPEDGASSGAGSSGGTLSAGTQLGPNRVLQPITAVMTTQPAVYINGRVIAAGDTPVTIDGRPLSLDAAGLTATWGGISVPIAQLAALIGPGTTVSTTSFLVYKGQTLVPGGSPLTITSKGITQVLSMAAPTAPGASPSLVVLSQTGRKVDDIAKLIMLGLQAAGATNSKSSANDVLDNSDPLAAPWLVSAALAKQKSTARLAKAVSTSSLVSSDAASRSDAGPTGPSGGASEPKGVASTARVPLAMGIVLLAFVAGLVII
ncbi:hypothetical protein CAC42_1635 [Sphaceloma murrayae]|uniref:Uncharacterized protein n=1 Tax=Sphaceloma murrayae TaxID=2082308 RepID=A0A2K1QID9_9PEZI|nr:hypothetical protein CAC42_1635 [Sphaceloma murrayae]